MTIYSLDELLFLFGTSLLVMSSSVASWPAYRFLKRQVRWSGMPISWNFPQFIVIHTVRGFGIVNKAEIDVFLELCCFFDDPADVGNLISGSSAFSKTNLNIWKFTVHVLLKLGLENFEHYFASVWDECSCAVVWAFFGIAFLRDWDENWLFQSCGHCWVFQICWHIDCSTFTASSFRIWNSSTGFSIQQHKMWKLTQTYTNTLFPFWPIVHSLILKIHLDFGLLNTRSLRFYLSRQLFFFFLSSQFYHHNLNVQCCYLFVFIWII